MFMYESLFKIFKKLLVFTCSWETEGKNFEGDGAYSIVDIVLILRIWLVQIFPLAIYNLPFILYFKSYDIWVWAYDGILIKPPYASLYWI